MLLLLHQILYFFTVRTAFRWNPFAVEKEYFVFLQEIFVNCFCYQNEPVGIDLGDEWRGAREHRRTLPANVLGTDASDS